MRALRDIATEIATDWTTINNRGAKAALDCMLEMGLATEPFLADPDGYCVIGTFLTHSQGWRGPNARRIKKELRVIVGHPRP